MGRPTDPNFWQQSPPPQTGDMNNERTLNQRFMRELPGALPPQDVIIHDGAISGFESAALIVDTEGEADADELNVINIVLSANENLHPGMIITLRAKDPARVVTVKNSAAANGINTADGNDIVLSAAWELTLRLVGGRWYEVPGRASAQAAEALSAAEAALARTAPATTTSRGIARVATLADMEPGAVIANGPAFLDAETVKITPTPTPNAVPQADASGKLDAWVQGLAELENKLNADFSNKPSNIHYVTKTWHNSEGSWYRVWSDGWIEQGGLLQSDTEIKSATWNLAKAFSNVNYTITCGIVSSWSGTLNSISAGVLTKSTASFTYYINANSRRYWRACGY